jgi:hypothetical protein
MFWHWFFAASVLAAQSFERDLQPVFRKHCYGCHAANVKIGSLDLETHEGIMRGGNQGTIVVPGKAAESRLYLTLTGVMEPAMPMGGKRLAMEELQVVRQWIDAGARPDAAGLAWRGGVLVTGFGGDIRVLDEEGRLVRKFAAGVGTVRRVALSKDGRLVGAGGNETVRMFEAATGKEVTAVDMEFKTGRMALSPDGRRRAVMEEDGSVRIEDVR